MQFHLEFLKSYKSLISSGNVTVNSICSTISDIRKTSQTTFDDIKNSIKEALETENDQYDVSKVFEAQAIIHVYLAANEPLIKDPFPNLGQVKQLLTKAAIHSQSHSIISTLKSLAEYFGDTLPISLIHLFNHFEEEAPDNLIKVKPDTTRKRKRLTNRLTIKRGSPTNNLKSLSPTTPSFKGDTMFDRVMDTIRSPATFRPSGIQFDGKSDDLSSIGRTNSSDSRYLSSIGCTLQVSTPRRQPFTPQRQSIVGTGICTPITPLTITRPTSPIVKELETKESPIVLEELLPEIVESPPRRLSSSKFETSPSSKKIVFESDDEEE
eukprot:NODE_4860_length_1103_cov_21.272449_g4315_i0.p1 GENE.NODE_4860_length_1103_cov_21.272449_g4315_i0~~NODE_4860_length_1103_cov_21.272449_g4315_i0.p1  ORF type:complete len:324 (+),score=41.07 NODE_4860_length_1103_cov_21.272449_g4315_i0:51-1022(+)